MSSHPAVNQQEQASELLDLVLSATQEGLVEHDLVRKQSHYSERWHRVLGFDEERRLQETPELWQELSHSEDLPDVLQDWTAHIENGWPFQRTWRMRHFHGGYRWVLCRSVVRLSPEGEPSSVLSLFSDVSEQVERAERHRALVEAIPDTILRVTIDGEVIDRRDGLGDVANYLFSSDRTEGGLHGLLEGAPGVAETLLEAAKKSCVAGQVQQLNVEFEVGSTKRHLEVRVSPSGGAEVVCLIRDITDTKRLESQLLQAQKLESIGQLAAGVAHEINTPLQFIGDNARFAQTALARFIALLREYRTDFQSFADEEQLAKFTKLEKRSKLEYLLENGPSALEACVSGVERVAEIVTAMKEFSHPGSDKPVASDLNRALKSTATVSKAEWKHIAELEFELAPDLPVVSCFAGEINQCFLNIIVNAAHAMQEKFGDAKDGRIEIRTLARPGGVEVRIRDNGPGIPEHVRQRIYDPFFTTKAVGKGTGQGLSLARRTIVDKHGGELECESRVGEGTTFIIRLPFSPPENDLESNVA